MKALTLAVALLATTNAFAISRYNSKSYTCAEIKNIVSDEGAVILRYPSIRVPGLTLYDRYVAHSGYCFGGEERNRAYVPTDDTSKCPVYNCKQRDNGR